MAAGFEILESPEAVSPKGSFITKADPTKFRSAFYPEDSGAETAVLSKDGRTRLGFTEFVGENKGRNIVKVPGMTTRMKEYITTIEDARKFEAYAGAISEDRVASYLEAHASGTQNGTEVGISSSGQQETVVLTRPTHS